MPFSRRPKASEVSADDRSNITTAAAARDAHDDDSSNAEKKAVPSLDTDVPMPNHAPPGSGFGKLGDEEYELRDVDSGSRDDAGVPRGGGNGAADNNSVLEGTTTEYRTYKRRWFGLAQLTLLNIVVSWDVSGNKKLHFCPRRPG